MSWEGYNFEDAIILSERLVKDDVLSSVHIEEYEVDARTTKLGDEEITRDIPNRSEESLKDLDERGIVRIGAEVNSGDLLVGKVTPKGETELTAEEKLIRAIFKEKAREVRDTSLKVPHGEGGKVIDVKIFSRENNDELPPSVNELVRVYVAKKRKIAEGDKLAGRHGNKGVISKIVPEEDMPYLEDGHARRHHPQPAGRAEPHEHRPGARDAPRLGRAPRLRGRRRAQLSSPACVASPVFDGATLAEIDDLLIRSTEEDPDSPVKFKVNDQGTGGSPLLGQGLALRRPQRQALRQQGDDRLHVHPEAAPPGRRQDPRAQHGPVLARHAAAAGRQGAVRRPALRRDGGLGPRSVRRGLHLQEMLTIKSDDTVGRVKAYEAIVKGENISKPNIPESFKVLMKEVQSLSLDMQVQSEEGGMLEVHEEDDDLLRAAEELGIDLSASLRRQARASASEALESARPVRLPRRRHAPVDESDDEPATATKRR